MINLSKPTTIGAIASCALILSACSLYQSSSSGGKNVGNLQQSPASQVQQQSQQQTQSAATITFSDSGVGPSTVTVKSDESITWVNNSSKAVQVASDPHPTHTANRELSGGQSTLQIAPGASASVTLKKRGSWGFHDHVNPSVTGKVVVE